MTTLCLVRDSVCRRIKRYGQRTDIEISWFIKADIPDRNITNYDFTQSKQATDSKDVQDDVSLISSG